MTAPIQLVSTAFISADPTNKMGGVYLDSGNIVSNGSGSLTAATMAPTLLSGGVNTTAVTLTKTETITPSKRVVRSVCSTSTASAITLATASMLDGQELTLIHLGPSTITLSGNVLGAAITSAATGAYAFTYDATTTAWYHKV